LLEHGANVNQRDKYDITPLHIAASNNNSELCELLLNYGADITAGDKFKKTSLHKASYFRCLEVCELLLNRGADMNAKDDKGETPLDMAFNNNLIFDYNIVDLFNRHKIFLQKRHLFFLY
jgi:ankyrin repeat protein